MFFFHFLSTL